MGWVGLGWVHASVGWVGLEMKMDPRPNSGYIYGYATPSTSFRRLASFHALHFTDDNRRGVFGSCNYDSTSIRRPFDCLSKVIEVTVT